MLIILIKEYYWVLRYAKITGWPKTLPILSFFSVLRLYADARGYTKGGGNGGKHGDDDVEDLSPDVLVFHFFLIYDL